MSKSIRKRLSYANLVASLALFVALGGVSYAAVAAKNSVRSSSIRNGEVKAADIKNAAVTSAKIRDGHVAAADVNATFRADLDDASTLGGLSAAQLIAAAGGKYLEAGQAAGDVSIETLTEQTLVTLNLPEAGKYLIQARMPVTCTYDGSDPTNATIDPAIALQPWIVAEAHLYVGATLAESITQTCEAEAGQLIFIVPITFGKRVVEISRMVEVNAPTVIQLRGLADASFFFSEFPAAGRINATAQNSKLQAVTVRT